MQLSAPQTMQILSIAFLWVMFLCAIRFSASTALTLRPLFRAAGKIAAHGFDRAIFRQHWFEALSKVQDRYAAVVCTPWSIPLLLSGLVMIGLAISMLSGGDIMVLVARHPERWVNSNQYMDWTGAMLGGLGFAASLAAVSRRRTVSFMISTGFAITGLGIGIIAAVYV